MDSNTCFSEPRVLVIEDDPTARELLQALLEDAGYTVDCATSGPEGLSRILDGGMDLVLLDLMLPELDGLEVCRRARAETASAVPIVMVTALSTPEERHRGFSAGADDYVSKPYSAEDLLDRVHVWVHHYRRVQAMQDRLRAEQQALREAERRALESRLEGVILTARELAHLLNNELAPAVGILELLQYRGDLPPDMQEMSEVAARQLEKAVDHVRQLQRVVRVETKETPFGPALDLERSAQARP
jgi:two-component system, OmpR family, response regulator ResD